MLMMTIKYTSYFVTAALLIVTLFSEVKANAPEPTTTRTLHLSDAKAKYAGTASKFANIDGVDIHYRDEGSGPALLLLHGTLGDLTDWDEWTQQLSQQFRVVRLDLPGFGLSGDMPNKNYSVERSHIFIDALMDQLDIDKFGVVGISYGGMVVFRYAATRTERVTAMVLINSAGIQRGKAAAIEATANQKPTAPPKNIFTDPVVHAADVERFYQGYINDSARRTPELIQRKLDFLNIRGRSEVAIAALSLYEQGNPRRVLSHVRAPSLIMWGTANQALDIETAQAFVDALHNACARELVTFADGGHYINLERPLETVTSAKAFLTKYLKTPTTQCTAP